MRDYCIKCLGLVVLIAGMLAMGGPVNTGSKAQVGDVVQQLTPQRFRCILVGDSQTIGPSSNRIRTQNHRWEAPMVGELITVGSARAGFVVNNSNAGIENLDYSSIDLNDGWPDGGPADFFAALASGWFCRGDIQAPGFLIGRFRLRFGAGNTDAPWQEPWGINNLLVAKIAVRTSPMSVDAIETRPERGGVVSFSDRRVHTLKKTWGVQIIEQPIPVDFNPMGDDVGVGLYFPGGSVEQDGQVFQVLGVVIERVDSFGRSLPGTVVGYQGRGGWGIEDHLTKISPASRVALVEMINAEYVMIMLGHNQESGGEKSLAANMGQLVAQWESVYAEMGRARPSIIFVTPWTIISESASPYMLAVESVMESFAQSNRRDVFINYLSRFDYERPDVYDSERYDLDNPNVHPGDIPTAVNLSQDLFEMLFDPYSVQGLGEKD